MKPSDYAKQGWSPRHFGTDKWGDNISNFWSPLVTHRCLSAAVACADLREADRNRLRLAITNHIGSDWFSWNANPLRTQAQVIHLLETAEREAGII